MTIDDRCPAPDGHRPGDARRTRRGAGHPLDGAVLHQPGRLRPRRGGGAARAPGCSSRPRPRSASPATTSPSTSGPTPSSCCATTTRWCGRCTTSAATGARASSNERSGSVGNIVCGYHQWTYAHRRLAAARRRPARRASTRAASASSRCTCASSRDWSSSASPTIRRPTSTTWSPRSSPYLAPHQLHRTKVAAQVDLVEEANWKLVMENNRECYHCEGGHPELICTFFPTYGYARGPDPGPAAARARALPAGRGGARAGLRGARPAVRRRSRSSHDRVVGLPDPARGAGRRRRVLHARRARGLADGCSATSTPPAGPAVAAHPAQRLVPLPRRPRRHVRRAAARRRTGPWCAPRGWCTRTPWRASTTTSTR